MTRVAQPIPRRYRSLATESGLLAGRLLTCWLRAPAITIQAVVFPTFLLITYKLLIGKSILRITGTDSVYSLVPMCAVAGAMFGSLAAAMSVRTERESGLLSRLWILPINRASVLTGRLLADAIRTLLSSVLISSAGLLLGLRFSGGVLATLLFLLVPVLIGGVFSTAVLSIATRARSGTVMLWLGVPSIGAVFSSSGVPPISLLPEWFQPLVRHQPMAPTMNCMRELALGGNWAGPLAETIAWAFVLSAVLLPLAITGYRNAAASRH